MKRLVCTLVALALVGASPRAWASCRWFGTQLECELGDRRLLIGTQAAADPGYAGAFRAQPLHGGDGLFEERPVTSWPLRMELQNVGRDPNLCWKFGDETYCH